MSANTTTTLDPSSATGDGSNKDILLIVASVAMAVATVFLILIVKLLDRCLPRNTTGVETDDQKEERVKELLNAHTKQLAYREWILAERLKHNEGVSADVESDAVLSEEQSKRLGSAPKEDEVWATDCAVCLAEFEEEELVNELECEHIFHNKCIHDWFMKAKQAACPLCRSLSEAPQTIGAVEQV